MKKSNFPFNPKKELGQNFLLDENILQKIVDACQIDKQTVIIEIGSGYGHLTSFLAKTSCHEILSYEKDENLFDWLEKEWRKKNKQQEKVIFFHQDALKINWQAFFDQYQKKSSLLSFLIVGNLPYSIANSLLINLLEGTHFFRGLAFLVQREVAQRWTANSQKFKKEYSALSVYINIITEPKIIFDVPKHHFSPQPPVDGSLVYLKARENPLINKKYLNDFFRFVRNCFRYRRKTLWNNLLMSSLKENEIEQIFQKLDYGKKIRPQQLTVQDYPKIYLVSKKL